MQIVQVHSESYGPITRFFSFWSRIFRRAPFFFRTPEPIFEVQAASPPEQRPGALALMLV